MGIWKEIRDDISATDYVKGKLLPRRVVRKKALRALPYETKIRMMYDLDTPAAVVLCCKNDPDAAVVRSAHQRPLVLAGELQNPFEEKEK